MAPRVRTHKGSLKAPLDLGRGYFYAGEVARILKLEGVDYKQLRDLFEVVREQAGSPISRDGSWSRFTFRDLVALKAAFLLAGGMDALAAGRRLRIQDVKRICIRLRELGLSNPLTEIAFRRRGKMVIAQVQGLLFEPGTGQMLLTEVEEAVERYFDENPARLVGRKGRELKVRLQQDAREMKEADPSAQSTEARVEVSFR
jgi:hypothetical protein